MGMLFGHRKITFMLKYTPSFPDFQIENLSPEEYVSYCVFIINRRCTMLRLISCFSAAAIIVLTGCRVPNGPPPGEGTATFYVHVITNGGGPSMKPLEGAPVYVEDANGKFVTAATSDANGDFQLHLGATTYVIDPQPVPGTDFYKPPEKYKITLKDNEEYRDTLDYNNPIL
jgi:hypothetical protein